MEKNESKTSFWENMWIFLIVLVFIGVIYNIVEWITNIIQNKQWTKLIIWISITIGLYILFKNG